MNDRELSTNRKAWFHTLILNGEMHLLVHLKLVHSTIFFPSITTNESFVWFISNHKFEIKFLCCQKGHVEYPFFMLFHIILFEQNRSSVAWEDLRSMYYTMRGQQLHVTIIYNPLQYFHVHVSPPI